MEHRIFGALSLQCRGIYCSELAQAAVHAAMAGYTGLTVGKVDQHASGIYSDMVVEWVVLEVLQFQVTAFCGDGMNIDRCRSS